METPAPAPTRRFSPAVTPRPVIIAALAVVLLAVGGLQRYSFSILYGPLTESLNARTWLWISVGVGALFCFLASSYSHAYRTRGLVAWASVVLTLGWVIGFLSSPTPPIVFPVLLAVAFGISVGATLRAVWTLKVPLLVRVLFSLFITFWLVLANRWVKPGSLPETFDSYPILIACLVLNVVLAVAFARPMFELFIELFYHYLHNVKATGPGLAGFPAAGPVLVISNHSALTDPLYVAQVIPRPFTAIMTMKYYKIWFLKPILKYLFQAIPVPEESMRREAPELIAAIEALNNGRCLVIFPEGYLQRKEEPILRRFGRGVWEILKAQPDIPVVPIWIEGNWGSYFSHKDGPPMKGKKLGFRRPIHLGLGQPFRVPEELLNDHLKTRFYLMNQVSAARVHAGLEPLPKFEIPTSGTDVG